MGIPRDINDSFKDRICGVEKQQEKNPQESCQYFNKHNFLSIHVALLFEIRLQSVPSHYTVYRYIYTYKSLRLYTGPYTGKNDIYVTLHLGLPKKHANNHTNIQIGKKSVHRKCPKWFTSRLSTKMNFSERFDSFTTMTVSLITGAGTSTMGTEWYCP